MHSDFKGKQPAQQNLPWVAHVIIITQHMILVVQVSPSFEYDLNYNIAGLRH